jgi:hypothetical protein
MAKTKPQTHCPDCGQEYKDPRSFYPPPPVTLELREMSQEEWTADAHRDFECPVQKERELEAGLEEALRYFGIPGTLARIAGLVKENEHDAEVIYGNPARQLKNLQADGGPLQCPHYKQVIAWVQKDPAWRGETDISPVAEVACNVCGEHFPLAAAVAAAMKRAAPKEGEQDARPKTLQLVEPKEDQS